MVSAQEGDQRVICQDCRNGYHEGCRGKTWCPCQHRGHQCSRECNHETPGQPVNAVPPGYTFGHQPSPITGQPEYALAGEEVQRHPEIEAERDMARRQIEMIRTEWHQADADREAARPVVEAAAAWRGRIVDDPRFWADDEDFALIAAVDLYRSATTRNLDSDDGQ